MERTSQSGSTSRRLAVVVVAASAVAAGAVSGSPSLAAEGDQIVFINAVNGPDAVDVYLDGALTEADLDFGEVSAPLGIADTGDHTIELFDAESDPAATAADRSDDPVEPGPPSEESSDAFASDEYVGDTFAHVGGLVVARLANESLDGVWGAFTSDPTRFCTPGRTGRRSFNSADLWVQGPEGSSDMAFSEPAVVVGARAGFDTDLRPYAFGTFDFGRTDYAIDTRTSYFAYGNEGRYGAAEVVVDCIAGQFISTRSASPSAILPPSAFVPLQPTRLFDTRTPTAPSGALGPEGVLDVQVTGAAGVPTSDVTAVVMNVTAVNAAGPGFFTVWPTGSPQGLFSSLNTVSVGQTVPNLVTVPVGDDGQVSFFSSSGSHLVADVSGYFVATDTAQAGRFVPVDPARVFDTRTAAEPSGPVAPGGSISVSMEGASGVPASGASAVVLNVTGIATQDAGFATAWPSGTDQPEASNLNLSRPGDIAPNLVIVPLGADGSVDFYTSGGAHLLADVFGYFTDDSAPDSDEGLFVPAAPARIFDSRPFNDVFGDVFFIDADTSRTIEVAAFAMVPGEGASAVMANVTATQAAAPGFVSVWPSDLDQPEASNLNLTFANETRPNAVLVPLSADGDVDLYSQGGTHVAVDVFGYFTS